MAKSNLEKFKDLLAELFMFDRSDLDFGIYRIMNAKRDEITQFLDSDLLPQVRETLSELETGDRAEIESELNKAEAQARDLGVDPVDSPKVKDLWAKLGETPDVAAIESEVFSDLYSFFRRYYHEGDFISLRRYKEGVYAIPHEGEEVKLHWANADQYYVKSSEWLRDYAFTLADGRRVRFKLVDAQTSPGDTKPAPGQERRFILCEDEPLAEADGELHIRFGFRPDPEKRKQAAFNAAAVESILGAQGYTAWIAGLVAKKPTEKNPDRTLLEKHLNEYTARNTFDYFIHKDLGGFLRRELDFYIKNEVMHLDDIESETAPRVEQYLGKIKALRRIAHKIIAFLAQLEGFQKKLWLKKKFVVETSYCIRLGCISPEFYDRISSNEAQREEWIKLHSIDESQGDLTTPAYSVPLAPDFLNARPTLMLDTRHFDAGFTAALLGKLGSLDEQTDGTLIHSENFQALALAQSRYRRRVRAVYLDPPYNTDASPILYKNGYRRSSWISLLSERLILDKELREEPSVRCFAIDDFEYADLRGLLEGDPQELLHATATIRSKPQGRPTATGFSANHEYAIFWGAPDATIGRLPRLGSKAERYPHSDEKGSFAWANFRKAGTDSDRLDRPKSFYPVFRLNDQVRIPNMTWDAAREEWDLQEEPGHGEIAVWPIDSTRKEKVWTCSPARARAEIDDIRVAGDADGGVELQKKYRPNQQGALPGTWWSDPKYSASESGTKVLKDLFGRKDFDYPKSISLVEDCLRVLAVEGDTTVLDYFAGSGTTGHAAINLNREDGQNRRFLLVEMGPYFSTVLVPRLKKTVFAPEWKDGRPKGYATPQDASRTPRILKVIRLESYEDALNNLEPRRNEKQEGLLFSPQSQGVDGLREQYMLRYMLDVEARGSQSLLNVAAFTDPTAYKLKVQRPGSDETREVNVDLLETFNWLIGLTVQHIAAPQTFSAEFERDDAGRLQLKGRLQQADDGPFWFRRVEGVAPNGDRTLIVWRKSTGDGEQDNLALDHWMTEKLKINTRDFEFGVIYVNGDNNLENLKRPDDTWKVRLLEEEFHRLMFDVEDV